MRSGLFGSAHNGCSVKTSTSVFCLLLLLPAAQGSGDPPAEPRVVEFDGGSAVITTNPNTPGYERVEMRDAHGRISGLSTCGGNAGTYDQIVAFTKTLRDLVAAGRREAVADLVHYPLRVNVVSSSKSRHIADRKTLLAHYEDLFDPVGVHRLQPFQVFCKDDMAMLGSGYMWIQADDSGQLKIAVINT